MRMAYRAVAVMVYTQAARISIRESRPWSRQGSPLLGAEMHGSDSDNAQLIEVVKSIGPHEHLCLIYSSREEQFAAIGPFLEIGLQRREKLLYIADENSAVTVRDAVRERGIDVDRHLRDGTFIITDKKEVYIEPGYFDSHWTL